MIRSGSRGRTGRTGSPSAARGRDARGRSVSQGRQTTRHSPSPIGRAVRPSASPLLTVQRKASPHPSPVSPRPKSRKWSSADPVSKKVLESTGRRHVSNTVARASQGLYDAKQFSRNKSLTQQPTTPRNKAGIAMSTRYSMEPLPRSLTKPATPHSAPQTGSQTLQSRGPGRDYKSTNEEAIKVMKRVKRLMSVIDGEGQSDTDDDGEVLAPPLLQQQLNAQEMRHGGRPIKHHISPPKLQGAGYREREVQQGAHIYANRGVPGHTITSVARQGQQSFATPAVNKSPAPTPSKAQAARTPSSADTYSRFNSEGFVRGKYAEAAVPQSKGITSPSFLRTSTGTRQQYMIDTLGGRYESRVGGPGGRGGYQSYYSTLQQALLHQRTEGAREKLKEDENEARKLDYSSDNITASDVTYASELDLSAASKADEVERVNEEVAKAELTERIKTKEVLMELAKEKPVVPAIPPRPLPDRSILDTNRAKSEELLILLSKSSPSRYSNPRSNKSTPSPSEGLRDAASPPANVPAPPPDFDTDIPPPPPPPEQPDTTVSVPVLSTRVSWPVEPSPMRTDFALPSYLPATSASPEERGKRAGMTPSPIKRDMQAPAVSPSVALEKSVSPQVPPLMVQVPATISPRSPIRSPIMPTGSPQLHSPQNSVISPTISSLPPPPPMSSPPRSPSPPDRSLGLRTGNEEANIIRVMSTSPSTSPSKGSREVSKQPLQPERVFSPPPQAPQRSTAENLIQSLLPQEKEEEEELDRCAQEAEWLRKAGRLYASTGLTGTPDLGLLSMVITSKIVEPKNSEMRQLMGDTVAQAVGIAREKVKRDALLGVRFGGMRVRSLAAQMKAQVGQKEGEAKVAEEVVKICDHWADMKEAGGLANDNLALTETLHAVDSWKLSSKESREHVLEAWTESLLNSLLKDTAQYFNTTEEG